MAERILICGAGGFIGHWMARFLKQKGYWVRGVDIKYPEFSSLEDFNEFLLLDLRDFRNCVEAVDGIDKVYNFAANMGGIGFITAHKADVMRDNVLINVNIAEASLRMGVKRVFFSSSACVYPIFKQEKPELEPLKESDAYPAYPDNEYGWEKLYSERVYQAFMKDFGLEVRIARFHNIYGPEGTFEGGREKSPAALCRKIALAKNNDEIEIWGDGKQTRSYCYIQDCLEGTFALMESDIKEPLNIGSDNSVTINELVDIIAKIAGKKISKRYNLSKPQGVRGRNADLTKVRKLLGWEPKISLEEGLERTYKWIEKQLREMGRI